MADDRYDIVVHGGTVLDGICDAPYAADIGIVDDRVVAIGDLGDAHASRRVSAVGMRVAPGFIDIHTHSDISITFHQPMVSMISQGVTTQVTGNCSLCLGLATSSETFAFEQSWLDAHGARICWTDLDGHLKYVREIGCGTNYVMLAGHGTIRKRVMGMADRYADRHEIEAMKRELVVALEQGAWGISTGLEYTPSGCANLEELVALSSVVRRYGGFYATHLRNEGDALLEAVAEALAVGEQARVAVQLSHHKAEGRRNWGKVHETIKMVDAARQRGVDVEMDQYPYTAFMTNLATQILPPWAVRGSNDEVLARLQDPTTRQGIAAEVRDRYPDLDDDSTESPWELIEIGVARGLRSLQGRTVASLAREQRRSAVDVALDLVVHESNFLSAINHGIGAEDVRYVMQHPLTMIGSDAVGTGPEGKTGDDPVHPRCYGTFPRVLGRYVRQAGVITEAEAIKKMTVLPATRLGLTDRGKLAPGAYADIVVYDPNRVEDTATYEEPHRVATGIQTVLTNGRITWDAGAWTGALPGRVLRRGP